MTRLRGKLLAAMIALVVVTLGLSALFTRRVTHDQVRRLLLAQPAAAFDEVARALEDHLRVTGGWTDVAPVLERIAAAQRGLVVLTTPDRALIAAPAALRIASVRVDGDDWVTAEGEPGGPGRLRIRITPLRIRDAAGQAAALAYVLPPALDDDRDDPVAQREIAAVDRRLIAIFAIATLAAVLLTVLLSRRITRPIEQLTAAVHDMARGQVPQHVQVTGRDEIARLATSFNAMADVVTAQEALRRRMVGDVAHELRTPLTNLRCELEAIQDGLATPDGARVASIHEEVLHLQRLVEDLQDLAVAEAGALQLHREHTDLHAAIARIVGGQADVDATDDQIVVDADPTRLRQIVHNLVANAVRHTPEGTRVRVRVARVDGEATVTITDRGPGIAAPDLERIFERFYRVDEARGRAGGGAGLGLAIVRRMVELHGGRVWAASVAGEGATFTFTLPLAS